MSTVIKIENLYKEYVLGVIGHGTLHRDLQSWWAKTKGKPDPNSLLNVANPNQGKERVLAIDNINLEVKEGEIFGIIGSNGAGKSTLLKILSKITAPTSGTIKYKGRVAGLLEVGTGFHPELTGRENIYLNGAILGMKKHEVDRKFDEIVDFSGVEKFIDTPIKRYSSGMNVRLGFAVAAHLEPEILLIDEVLAVGDAEFQKKCLGKMKNISGEGRTVLFVSHNMGSIQSLCDKAMLLKNGKIIVVSEVSEAIDKYLYDSESDRSPVYTFKDPPVSSGAYISEVRLKDESGQLKNKFFTYEKIFVEIDWNNVDSVPVNCGILLKNGFGTKALLSLDVNADWDGTKKRKSGSYKSTVEIPMHLLNTGDYYISASLDTASPRKFCYHSLPDILHFRIDDPFDQRSITKGNFRIKRDDVVCWPALDWTYEKLI